jgi:hypothetical protein
MRIEDGSNEDYGCHELESFCRYLGKDLIIMKDKKSLDEILNQRLINSPPLDNIYSWGWLGNKVPEGKLWEDEDRKFRAIEAMKSISEDEDNIVDHFCGFHVCEICDNYCFGGSIKIKYKDFIFCCPNGVDHYMEEHNYKPDEIVINAICDGMVLKQYDLTKMGYELYKKGIAHQMKIIKEKMLKEKIENQKFAKARKEHWESLTQKQKDLINGSLNGTFDFIKID